MQDKLKKLFEEIKLSEDLLGYFDGGSISKVVVYDGNKNVDFIINTKEVLPIDVYDSLVLSLKEYFNSFEGVRLYIRPEDVDNSLIEKYYIDIMKNICANRSKYKIFLDREVDISDNVITVKTFNKVECTNMLSLKQEIIDKMEMYGFKIDINIPIC